MYQVKIDGELITVTQQDLDHLDAAKNGEGYHLLENNQSYKIADIKTGRDPKTGSLTVDHKRFAFEILDSYDQLVESMGLNVIASSAANDISAPMPGLILDIMVTEGDTIKAGDSILILEAMKMENVIKSEGAGIVKSVNNKIGETVEKGRVIIELESASA